MRPDLELITVIQMLPTLTLKELISKFSALTMSLVVHEWIQGTSHRFFEARSDLTLPNLKFLT
jgi:hypothetical protein